MAGAKRPASTVSLLLVLTVVALSSAACPGGWTLWDDGGKCYKVTVGRFNVLGCATACGENASLACISSSSEAEFVVSLTRSVGDVWIGLYQSPGGTEPGGGWDRCASGEATNFTNWLPGYPDDYSRNYGIGQQCAAKGRAYLENRWYDLPCYHPLQCLCELGATASAEYLSFIEADMEEGLLQLSATAGFLYGMIVMCWLWLPALLCTLLACFRLHRSLRRPKVIGESPETAASASSRSAADASMKKLADAEAKGKRLRLRVSGTLVQLAWMLAFVALIPAMYLEYPGVDLTLVAGAPVAYYAGVSWACALFVLALRPTDAKGVPIACAVAFLFFVGLTVLLVSVAWLTTQWPQSGVAILVGLAIIALICLLIAALLWPTLNVRLPCCAKAAEARLAELTELVKQNTEARKLTEAERVEMGILQQKLAPMSPRRQLLRLWLAFRLALFGAALIVLALLLNTVLYDPFVDPLAPRTAFSFGVMSASWFTTALVCTPANRGRIVALLGALGKSDKAENEAAALAALVNNLSAAEAFKRGTERFRALPLAKLTPADLPGSMVLAGYSQGMSAAAQPTKELCDKTYSAKLGEVDAFISHSWSDDGDAKFDRLQQWAAGRDSVSVWLDKACLDQRDITASLAGLPVFLAGCKKLLVLAGPTYASRLWCVMEIFVFVRMGGKQSDMVVRLLSGTTDLAPALLKFDAGKAETFDPNDRERLWAVIEASFGTFDPFNKVVRDMFGEKLQRGRSSHFGDACTVTVEPDDAAAAAPSL
jgi:hypothetical protein